MQQLMARARLLPSDAFPGRGPSLLTVRAFQSTSLPVTVLSTSAATHGLLTRSCLAEVDL